MPIKVRAGKTSPEVQTGHNVQQLRGSVRTGSQPHRLADLGGQQRDEHIRDVEEFIEVGPGKVLTNLVQRG